MDERRFKKRTIFLIVYLVFAILPVYWMVNMSFKTNEEILSTFSLWPQNFTLDHYKTIFTDVSWYSGYINSLIYVAINTVISLVVALPAAYAFSRYRFLGDKHVFFWLLTNRMTPPAVFLGAAINPFVPPFDFRTLHFANKIRAGAQFVQSQYCYDVPLFREFMKRVRDMGLHEQCYILVGVGPLASAKTAKWMRSNVPGVHIPDAVIKRIEGAADQKEEGKRLCIDIINEVKEIEGVQGVHVMAYRQEEYVAEMVHESGVLKGRKPWMREARRDEQQVVDRLGDLLNRDAISRENMNAKAVHAE